MTLKLVIFDCDGVLVDTEVATNTIIADNLNQFGLSITPHETHTLFAGGTMESVGVAATRRGAILPKSWLDDIYEEIFVRLRKGVAVIDGVVDLIDQLEHQNITIAIASNGPLAKMEITLRPSGLWERFAGRIYSGHDHTPKPAPDMLFKIMADAGVVAAQTVMIDDMASGCLAAQAAGIRCFGYVADGDPSRINGTDAVPVTSFEQASKALNLS
jgi:HAD superfamily hydrolase (TIGR01509 family)